MAEVRNAGQAFGVVLVDELARHGVADAVVAPGSRSTPVALALAADPRVTVHVRYDERSASYLALGIARATGRPVPVLCTSGTAVAHFHGAVLEADQTRVPLLVLTADRPPELRGVGANQTVDQVGIYGSAARWACDVGVPEARATSVGYWRSVVSRAVAEALGRAGGPPGPVHLNLPLREPLTDVDDGVGFPFPVDGRADGAPWTAAPESLPGLPRDLADRIAAAEHGVVVAGDGLRAADATAVVTFAERAGWSLVAEPHSNARRGRNALHCVDAVLRAESFLSHHRADLAVVVGRPTLSRAVASWLANTRHVVVDAHGGWWDTTRTAEAVYRCAPAALATADGSARSGWADAWREAAATAGAAIDRILDDDAALTEPRVVRDLAARVPAGSALVAASSMPIRDLDLAMRPRADVAVYANRGVAGIDGFVSTARGVAHGHAGPTWAVAGDLSLLHDANGLAEPDATDLSLVVLNNDGGGIFSLLPQASDTDHATFERLFGTPHGVDVGRLAAAYGARHELLATGDDLAAALGTVPRGVTVYEVRTDRAANADLHERLRIAAAAALR